MPAGPGDQTPARSGGLGRGASRFFRRHRWASLAALITWPVLWLVVIYLGSLAVLVVSAFFSIDEFTNQTTTDLTMANVEEVLGHPPVLGHGDPQHRRGRGGDRAQPADRPAARVLHRQAGQAVGPAGA